MQSGRGSQQNSQQDNASASQSTQQGTTSEPKKVWVDAVYKTVEHPEEGHWETVTQTRTVQKVICGGTDHNPGDPNYNGPFGGDSPIFDDYNDWKAHQEAFLKEMRKEDPYYQCTGRHRPAQYIDVEESYEEQVYVVDKEAWSEKVCVSEGHWEYE